MFEEICLVCGKRLQDDGRAYCSDDCQSSDLASPSISSSSSALSSPHLGFANGGDVPPLVPSALGSALRKCQGRDTFYVSSSSASSTSWSILTDEEDEALALGAGGEFGYPDGTDSLFDGSSKSANFAYSIRQSALSYARRPSGTNNHSTVPQLQSQNSSDSSPGPRRGVPRSAPQSAPNHSHYQASTDEEENFSDFSQSSRELFVEDNGSEKDYPTSPSTTTKPRRSRNRTSLPAYFSLLQISSPAKEVRTSPVSSSSGNTIARPSPPTPKIILSAGLINPPLHPALSPRVYDTPRGRRRDAGDSRSSRRSERSPYSRSRSRHVRGESPRPINNAARSRVDSRGSVEQVFDWATIGLPRGRNTIRRNSSPPPRMLMGVEDPVRALAALREVDAPERSKSGPKNRTQTRNRGRVGVDELEGVGSLADAPGYGNGRSGLMDRGRVFTTAMRVPL